MSEHILESEKKDEILKKKLLFAGLPLTLPGLTIDCSAEELDNNTHFFQCHHSNHHSLDFIIGTVTNISNHQAAIASSIVTHFKHFVQPYKKSFHYSKERLWEKNLLNPNAIIEGLLLEINHLSFSDLSIQLFYGRINIEDKSLTYLDLGFNNLIHYNSKRAEFNFLSNQREPLKCGDRRSFNCQHIPLNTKDFFLFYFEDNHALKKSIAELPLMSLADMHEASATQLAKHFSTGICPSKQKSKIFIIKVNADQLNKKTKNEEAIFASNIGQLDAVKDFVSKTCAQLPGDSEKLLSQLHLVINEIFCNIIKHSYGNQPKGEIKLNILMDEQGIYLTFSDKGNTFNPTEVKFPNLSGQGDSGFGLFIIQQIVDSLTYIPKSSGDDWNHLRFFKRYFSEEDSMEFSHQISGNIIIIKPMGQSLDAKNASSFKDAVLQLVRDNNIIQLIIDLSNLQFIDSSGLGAFLALQRNLNAQGGTLKLANLNKPIRTMFEIVSMHRIFDIFNSTKEAIESF